jgi:pentapeptide repeat protein
VELRADCSRCVGLCCVAPAFARSADFAVDKPAGTPCTHLQTDFRCAIHADLRTRGFAGCTVFDCLGAGQRVTAAFAGRDWRDPAVAAPMFAAFAVARQVHELLWYLDEARVRAPDPALDEEWARLADSAFAAADLTALDVDAVRERVSELLRRASERLRGLRGQDAPPTEGESPFSVRRVAISDTASPGFRHGESRFRVRRATHDGSRPRARAKAGPTVCWSSEGQPSDYSRADLVDVRWQGADLRRASLRGALLLGANLRGADLRLADLLGADLRGADLCGADLSTSLFVSPMQAAAARGDATTQLPARVPRPAHWPT